jgi:uncharacterized SAM-binding protein YcdF (DUF218 family)
MIGRTIVLGTVVAAIALAGGFWRYSHDVAAMRAVAEPARADGIVVLTGGKARIESGLELLAQGKAKRLLISGVHPRTTEAAIRNAVGGRKDLFRCCVDIDKAALDTTGNAEEAGKWAGGLGFGSLIVVTSDYHMPRSLIEMRRSNPGLALLPHPVASAEGEADWLAEPDKLRFVAAEYLKYLAAGLRLHLGGGSANAALVSAGKL